MEAGGTQVVSVLAALPGAPAATSFASLRTLGPAKLRTQTSGSYDNQSTLTLPHVKRRGVNEPVGLVQETSWESLLTPLHAVSYVKVNLSQAEGKRNTSVREGNWGQVFKATPPHPVDSWASMQTACVGGGRLSWQLKPHQTSGYLSWSTTIWQWLVRQCQQGFSRSVPLIRPLWL